MMRAGEIFTGARLAPGAWTVIRLDGRAFTNFTAGRFAKPYDADFRDAMVEAAAALLEDFGGVYAATHSDEISVAFTPEWQQFGRRAEKIVSVAAGLVSAAFTHAVRQAAHFDARVWQGTDARDAVAYFRWRQEDAARCALSAWCYWTLWNAGMDGDSAELELQGRFTQDKAGYNPLTHGLVTATRRAVKRDFDLPMRERYGALLAELFEPLGAEVAHAS